MSRSRFTTALRRPGRGFTLLEVMLALGLTALVLIAVGMAIDIHLRLVDSNRTGVEEAQLARALLNRIADDLRNVPLYDPIDADKLVPDFPSLGGAAGGTSPAGAAAGGADAGAAAAGGADAGETDESEEGESETDESGGLTESTEIPSVPGLFGNAYQLQVDTSRLPRGDELDAMFTAEDSTVAAVGGDVKTVAYYVIDDQLGGADYASGASQNGNGLVRLEYDRATAAWAAEQGQLLALQQDVEPIAPEVAAIEFRYFDGTEVLEEWDSIERGGLPVAVEIAIGIIPARDRNDPQATSLLTTTQPSLAESEELLVYRRLVYLPVAQPTTADGTSSMMGESGEDLWEGFDSGSEATSTGGSALEGGSAR